MLICEQGRVALKGWRPAAAPHGASHRSELLLVVLCYQFFDVGQFVVQVFAAVLLLAVVGVGLQRETAVRDGKRAELHLLTATEGLKAERGWGSSAQSSEPLRAGRAQRCRGRR